MHKNSELILIFALVGALFLPACMFDPQPEPDPIEDDGKTSDAPNESTDPGGTGSVSDADDYHGDTGADESASNLPNTQLIYCSAPGEDDRVAIVGAPGAVGPGSDVTIGNSSGQTVPLKVAADGSFAGRIQAEPGEELTVATQNEQEESEPVTILAGIDADQSFGAEFLGVDGEINGPDAKFVVDIFGSGPSLESGMMVVGGNVTSSTGRSTLVSCLETCRFNLYIEAEIGDEIDLFVVPSNEQSGLTDYQTLVVPE